MLVLRRTKLPEGGAKGERTMRLSAVAFAALFTVTAHAQPSLDPPPVGERSVSECRAYLRANPRDIRDRSVASDKDVAAAAVCDARFDTLLAAHKWWRAEAPFFCPPWYEIQARGGHPLAVGLALREAKYDMVSAYVRQADQDLELLETSPATAITATLAMNWPCRR